MSCAGAVQQVVNKGDITKTDRLSLVSTAVSRVLMFSWVIPLLFLKASSTQPVRYMGEPGASKTSQQLYHAFWRALDSAARSLGLGSTPSAACTLQVTGPALQVVLAVVAASTISSIWTIWPNALSYIVAGKPSLQDKLEAFCHRMRLDTGKTTGVWKRSAIRTFGPSTHTDFSTPTRTARTGRELSVPRTEPSPSPICQGSTPSGHAPGMNYGRNELMTD